MRIAIAGGHGEVARHLSRRLVEGGDEVRGIVRDPSQADRLGAMGVEPVVLDLEETDEQRLAGAIQGVDAVVFAAGAGPGSGAARKETVDYGGAVLLVAAAEAAGVGRYVMISAMGAEDPPEGDDVFSVYLRAKARADRELQDSTLDWTIVRPGKLTEEPGTGRVELARHVERGEVPREDVARVLAAVLHDERTVGHVFEVVGGATPVSEAIDAAVGTGT